MVEMVEMMVEDISHLFSFFSLLNFSLSFDFLLFLFFFLSFFYFNISEEWHMIWRNF